jgi:hypothetical protein
MPGIRTVGAASTQGQQRRKEKYLDHFVSCSREPLAFLAMVLGMRTDFQRSEVIWKAGVLDRRRRSKLGGPMTTPATSGLLRRL